MSRNEIVTAFEAILRISVAKLVIVFFFQYEALLGNVGHFVDCFLTGGRRWVNCIKTEQIDNMRSRDYALLIIS